MNDWRRIHISWLQVVARKLNGVANPKPALQTADAWLVEETPEYIVIAVTRLDREDADVVAIPQGCIMELQEL
jgi:hypothetical protein